MKSACAAILTGILPTIAAFTVSVGVIGACKDEDTSSTFGADAAEPDAARNGVANTTSSSGGFNNCPPNNEGKSAAAPVVHLCGDSGTPDPDAGECEDDLAACRRICEELLKGYDYCGVDDGTDGGRVVRCTIAKVPCD